VIEGFLAPAGPARARWRALWRRVDLAVNKCEMLSRGSAGFALLQNPSKYGFTHGANEDACAKPDQDYCDAKSLASPDADRTYVFAAAEHMTTRANELLGNYVLQQIGLDG